MQSLMFVLDDIKKEIAKMDVFKYKTSDLLYILTDCVDKLALEVTLNPIHIMNKDKNEGSLLISHIGYAYRQILKFVYEYSSDYGLECDYDLIVDSFHNLLREMYLYYNEIRNRIERHELEKLELKYDPNSKTITEMDSNLSRRKFIRGIEINNIGNKSINYKMTYSNYLMKDKNAVKNFKYMQYFRYHLDKEYFDDLIKITTSDSEIMFDFDFGDFSYYDAIKICSALNYMAIFKQASNVVNIMQQNLTSRFYCESYETFIKHISEIASIEETIAKKIISYMIYNPNYQRSKLTLLQHLLKIDNNIIFSPYVLIPAELPKKFYRVVNDYDKEKYEKVFSTIAQSKEYAMINEITSNYQSNKKVNMKTNVIYKIPGSTKPSAEYDIIFYDSAIKTLYLCECKWFYVADGEIENVKVNKKIQDTIKHRLAKDKLIQEHIEHFRNIIYQSQIEIEFVKSMIISHTHMGDDDVEFAIPVIDFPTFKLLSTKYNFDISKVYSNIQNQSFINEIKVDTMISKFEYCGYKFQINRMQIQKI